ncbi:MAG: copper chaperone [Gemmatimonadales bacterium]|nr:MAG: copper chaperone [Gemmatimonadales bacterium]
MTETTLTIRGMTCGNCRAHVHKALAGTAGVISAEVDLEAGRAEVRYDAETASPNEMIAAVQDAGYDAEVETTA